MRLARSIALAATALVLAACAGAGPGWTLAPAASVTPLPSVAPDASGGASVEPSTAPSGEAPSAGPSSAPGGVVIDIGAQGIAFDQNELSVPAGQPFQIRFANNDAGIPHNVAIHQDSPTGPEVWKGAVFNGVETRTYDVPALAAGTYGFVCSVHPNMAGTLTAS